MQFGRNFPTFPKNMLPKSLDLCQTARLIFLGIAMFKHFNLHRFYDSILKKKNLFFFESPNRTGGRKCRTYLNTVMCSVQTSKGTPCVEPMSVHQPVCYLNRQDRPPFQFGIGEFKKKGGGANPVHIFGHIWYA